MVFKRGLIRYLLCVGVPYILAKYIEKRFWKHADPELIKKINKELEDFDTISEYSEGGLNTRGGFTDPIVLWLIKTVMTDFAIKVAIGCVVGTSIWSETADNAAAQLAKYGSAILTAPGKKFIRLFKRIKGIDPQHSMDIKEILFDKELTNHDKLELLKIKIQSVLKNLTGSKRKQFILFIIATLAFSVGSNFALFAWFMERLRALIGTGDDVDSIREHIIEVYKEYNAPLPRELVENLPEEIIESITNLT